MTKHIHFLASLALFTTLSSAPALAQMNNHSGHDMSNMTNMRSTHMIEILATVKGIKTKGRKINLSHGVVPEINWPPMTMDFPVSQNIDLNQFHVGDNVQFTLHRAKDGSLPLVEICKTNTPSIQLGLCASTPMNHDTMPGHGQGHSQEKSKPHSHHQGH